MTTQEAAPAMSTPTPLTEKIFADLDYTPGATFGLNPPSAEGLYKSVQQLETSLAQAKADLATAQKQRDEMADERNANESKANDWGWAHIDLHNAGYPDREKVGEDEHGNEDFAHVGFRRRVKAVITDLQKANREKAQLAEQLAAERALSAKRESA